MKTLEVEIPEHELQMILAGECGYVEFPLLPENFHTCCDMYIAGRKFIRIEDAMEDPELNAWLQENEIEIIPVRFDALILSTGNEESTHTMYVEDITMTYLNDEEGEPLYTEINGIDYRKILMKYKLRAQGSHRAIRKSYTTRGTCSTRIDVEVEDGVIIDVAFTGGCHGNLQGISALVRGMRVEDAIARLGGIKCGNKDTSCPDQLAHALALTVKG